MLNFHQKENTTIVVTALDLFSERVTVLRHLIAWIRVPFAYLVKILRQLLNSDDTGKLNTLHLHSLPRVRNFKIEHLSLIEY